MKKVIVFEYVREPTDGRMVVVLKERCSATFHQFGVNYEEFENGPGNFSTAIIELADGTVENIPVHMVKFVPPT